MKPKFKVKSVLNTNMFPNPLVVKDVVLTDGEFLYELEYEIYRKRRRWRRQ